MKRLTFGLPSMHAEKGEVRAFLPDLVAHIEHWGGEVVLEHGYGSGMGLQESDYLEVAPQARFADLETVYAQDYVLVLRYPQEDLLRWMRPGACLISMIHYPTRPGRVQFLRERGLEAISLDSLKDDTGRRLVENLRMVAWNGVRTAFDVLRRIYPDPPGFEHPRRPPIYVSVLGAGMVGMHVLPAAVRYGNEAYWRRMADAGVLGVQATVLDYDLTSHQAVMIELLRRTDVLVDATQRPDPSKPVVPNEWLAFLPLHAVILDLSVDPYECEAPRPSVKAIEGIPHGNLDQYIFAPDDPAFDRLPTCVNAKNRRHVVSCYSWPGLTPRECMDIYGKQLAPILRTLIQAGGVQSIHPEGTFFERAIARAMLSRWTQI